MDKMREEFEKWANAEGLSSLFLEKHGFYDFEVTDVAWQAWQASRKALVVELPTAENDNWGCLPYERGMIDGINAMREDCMTALDATGISYK